MPDPQTRRAELRRKFLYPGSPAMVIAENKLKQFKGRIAIPQALHDIRGEMILRLENCPDLELELPDPSWSKTFRSWAEQLSLDLARRMLGDTADYLLAPSDDVVTITSDPSHRLAQVEAHDQLQAALSRLSDLQQVVFLLHMGGWDLTVIAHQVNMSVGHTRAVLRQAIDQIDREMGRGK